VYTPPMPPFPRAVLRGILLPLLGSLACSAGAPVDAGRKAASGTPTLARNGRPNVLLVVFDDLYYKIGVEYGVATPNLDRLARRGRRFDRAYTQYPLCNPSRVSFMTGWRPERTRVWTNADPPKATMAEAVPLQEHFQKNGYRTARFGKIYHTPFEDQFRWDVTLDAAEEDAPTNKEGEEEDFPAQRWATDRGDNDEPDGRSARRAAKLIEETAGKPFFVAVGFLRPHGPWIAPKQYFDRYPPAKVNLPLERPRDLDDVPRVALKRGAEPEIPKQKRREVLAAYQACVTFADAQLGVLLDTLDKQRLWDSTIVVALSDNGIERGEHGLWRKNILFEESARVPLIVVAPHGNRPGEASTSLVELLDLYPTLVALAGLDAPSGLDGTSLVPVLEDPGRTVKEAAFTVSSRGRQLGRSVRTDRYRYTEWRPDAAELYDHQTDPQELTNLVLNPRYAGTIETLKGLLRAGGIGAASPASVTP
jgi:iduronate 2-sulfatase